jgi:hypothetical protein
MHPSWITIYVKLKFIQMLPVTVAHHVNILTISITHWKIKAIPFPYCSWDERISG